jgi:hypothetical protein
MSWWVLLQSSGHHFHLVITFTTDNFVVGNFLEDNTAVVILSRFALAMARPFLDTMVII